MTLLPVVGNREFRESRRLVQQRRSPVATFQGDRASATRPSSRPAIITLFETEEARRGDEPLNQLNPAGGSRTAVEFYDVPVDTP
jgi:hypothetical protein